MIRSGRRPGRWVSGMLVLLLFMIEASAPTTHAQNDLSYVYFPQTGHYLGGAFRSFWERNGSVDIFGYPITDEYIRNSDGKLVQYFERARFELGATSVELGLLGREYLQLRGDIIVPIAPFPSTANRRYFPETGHSLQGAFKAFWERNNGVDILGYPISEEAVERFPDGALRVVQYFERVRLELHNNRVLIGRLGSVLAPCQLTPPLPPNNPPTQPRAEGDSSGCPSPIPVAYGRVFPQVSAPGTVLGFEARGYIPGETISLWLNLPDQSVRELPYTAMAAEDGVLLVGFRTLATDPTGQWSIVGRGVTSNRQVVGIFFVQR